MCCPVGGCAQLMRAFCGDVGATSPVVTPTPAPLMLSLVVPLPLMHPCPTPIDPHWFALSVVDEQLAGRIETPGGGGGPNGP